MLGPLLFVIYTIEVLEMMENKQFVHADVSTILAVVLKPVHRPAGCCLLLRDCARTQEQCDRLCMTLNPSKTEAYRWCMTLNPSKTEALVVSGSGPMNALHSNLVWHGVSICTSPNLDILGVKLDTSLRSNTKCLVLCPVSPRELVF